MDSSPAMRRRWILAPGTTGLVLAVLVALAAVAALSPLAASAGNDQRRGSANREPTRTVAPAPALAHCRARPTKHVDLAVNLDADAGPKSAPRALMLPYLALIANLRTPLTITDPNGSPRAIVLQWFRREGHEWIVAVTPPPPIWAPGELGRTNWVTPDPRSSGRLAFDGRGELVEPSEIRVQLASESIPAPNAEAQPLVHPEQELVLRFRTRPGVTTQYSSEFREHGVEPDGGRCRSSVQTHGACLLSRELRGDGIGGEGASIRFEDRGRLVSNRLQRIQGHRIDLLTGARSTRLSDARIPTQLTPPRPTREMRFWLDLDAGSPFVTAPFDVRDPQGTSQLATVLVAIDPLGRPLPLLLHVARVNANDWRWSVGRDTSSHSDTLVVAGFDTDASPGSEPGPSLIPFAFGRPPGALDIGGPTLNGVFLNGPPPPVVELLEGGQGLLRFDESGLLAAVGQEGAWLSPGALPIVRRIAQAAGEIDQEIAIDFGVGISGLGSGFEIFALAQDGYPAGVISTVRVSRDHVLEVGASSGVTFPISELAFAEPGDAVCRLACSNRRDDDGDGKVDYPGDAGCASGFDGTEQ